MDREVDLHAVELGQPTFGKAPEGFDAVDVCAALGEGFLFVEADVFVVADIDQPILTGPAVRANHAGRLEAALDHRPQRGLGTIRDDSGVNFSLACKDAQDRLLERAPASEPRQRTATDPTGTKGTFINFDHAAELPALIHSLPSDQEPEALVGGVAGLAVEPQKRRRLGGGQIEGKALHDFSNLVLA